jgi:polyisoprenoid-binding protein YceI
MRHDKRFMGLAGAAALAVGLLPGAGTASAGEALKIDRAHSNVGFRVRHINTMVSGRFKEFEGTIEFDEQNKTASNVTATIQTASVDTNVEPRDKHLRSPDFFDVEKNATISFASTGIQDVQGNKAKIKGQLTIHGVTKDVVLDTEFLGKAKDPRGDVRYGFQASTKINRKDFGMTWSRALETGGLLVGDDVEITLDVEALVSRSPAPLSPAAASPKS